MRKVHIGVTALMLTMALLVVGCSGTPAATTAGPTAPPPLDRLFRVKLPAVNSN